jgi:hypothetical protein
MLFLFHRQTNRPKIIFCISNPAIPPIEGATVETKPRQPFTIGFRKNNFSIFLRVLIAAGKPAKSKATRLTKIQDDS